MEYWAAVLFLAVIVIIYVFVCFGRIRRLDEGTDEMKELSGLIRDGANTFMRTEFRSIGAVVVVLALVFTLFVKKQAV